MASRNRDAFQPRPVLRRVTWRSRYSPGVLRRHVPTLKIANSPIAAQNSIWGST